MVDICETRRGRRPTCPSHEHSCARAHSLCCDLSGTRHGARPSTTPTPQRMARLMCCARAVHRRGWHVQWCTSSPSHAHRTRCMYKPVPRATRSGRRAAALAASRGDLWRRAAPLLAVAGSCLCTAGQLRAAARARRLILAAGICWQCAGGRRAHRPPHAKHQALVQAAIHTHRAPWHWA